MTDRSIEEIRRNDGAMIRYARRRAHGKARARLMLVHPLAMDHQAWDRVLPLLSDDIDVVAIDVRGHGRSTNGTHPLGLDAASVDMAALLDALGWPSAILAGCSMGGCLCLAFAQRHPERLDGLALIDTTAFYGEDAPAKWAERARTAEREGFEALLPFQRSRWFTEAFLAAHADIVERYVAIFVANDIGTYKAACAMMAGADLRAGLGVIAAPTAVVVGEHDYATPPDMARVLQKGIPGATLTVLPGMRHFSVIEAPDAVAVAVRDVIVRSAARQEAEVEA